MVGSALTASEEAQLTQTIEMFEVITQSQPQDYQSLEILKEAYHKLGRANDVISASKRIANAYVLMGQLSSAILEYESVLQRCPVLIGNHTSRSPKHRRDNKYGTKTAALSTMPIRAMLG